MLYRNGSNFCCIGEEHGSCRTLHHTIEEGARCLRKYRRECRMRDEYSDRELCRVELNEKGALVLDEDGRIVTTGTIRVE
jgi:hypothetical protein